MIRFQCPECGGIVAIESGDLGTMVECGHCSKIVKSPADRVSPGSVIGDFIIRREIGRGGMGIVYEAYQISLDRPAALKVLSDAYANNSEFVVGFIKEARAAAKLNHPHVVQAYAVGEDDGMFYLAMEFIDGETMKGYLKRQHIVEPLQAINIIQQIAEALSYAWTEQKLIHRDIKPDNIMLTSSGRAKLADLGLARVAGDVDDADKDEVMGTPQYICPEHLTGAPMDVRSDIYSLGATFYHFVTGRFPFEGSSAAEIAQKHITCKLTPAISVNKDVPQCVSMIIDKMMEKDPLMRYQDADSLVDDLRAARKMVEAGCTMTRVTSLLRSKDPASAGSSARLFTAEADEIRPSGLRKLFTGKAKYAVIGAAVVLLGGIGGAVALMSGGKSAEPVKTETAVKAEVKQETKTVAKSEVATKPEVKTESALVKSLRAELAYATDSKNKPQDIIKRGEAFVATLTPDKFGEEETKLAKELKTALQKAKARLPKPLTPEQKAALEKKKAAEAKARAEAAKKKAAAEAKKKAEAAKKAKLAAEAKKKAEAAKKAAAIKANESKNLENQIKRELAALYPRAYAMTSNRIIVTSAKEKDKYASEFANAVKLFEDWQAKWKEQAKRKPQFAGKISGQINSLAVRKTIAMLKACQEIHEYAYKGGEKMKGVYLGRYQIISTNWQGIDYKESNFESRLKVNNLNSAVKLRLIAQSAMRLRKNTASMDGISLLAYYHVLAGDADIVARMNLSMQQKQKLAAYFKGWKLPAKESQILLKKPAPPKKKAPAKKAPAKKAPAKPAAKKGPVVKKGEVVKINVPGASTTLKNGSSKKNTAAKTTNKKK